MYEKTPYTPGFRDVVLLAKKEAGRLGHDQISAGHYLLGILRKGDGIAAQTLRQLKVDFTKLEEELLGRLPRSTSQGPRLMGPDESAIKVLDRTKSIAAGLRHNWNGTEHLLIALMAEEETAASQSLRAMGLDYDTVRAMALDIVDGKVVGSSRVDLQACKLEYSIVSPK